MACRGGSVGVRAAIDLNNINEEIRRLIDQIDDENADGKEFVETVEHALGKFKASLKR